MKRIYLITSCLRHVLPKSHLPLTLLVLLLCLPGRAQTDSGNYTLTFDLVRGHAELSRIKVTNSDSIDLVIPATCDIDGVTYPVKLTAYGISDVRSNDGYYCRRLRSLTVQAECDSLVSIHSSSLPGLRTLIFEGKMKAMGPNWSRYSSFTDNLRKLRLPGGTAEEPMRYWGGSFTTDTLLLPDYFSLMGGNFDCTNVTVAPKVMFNRRAPFYYCRRLKKAVLEEGITDLPNYFFCGCDSLKDITFPSTLEHIGRSLLSARLERTEDGKDIHHLVPWAEAQPEGVLYLGKVAYNYIGNLPDGSEITFKPGTTCIHTELFYKPELDGYLCNYKHLGNELILRIPSSVKYIQMPFQDNDQFKFVLEEGNPYFRDNGNEVLMDGGKTLYYVRHAADDNSYTIPEGVDSICYGALSTLSPLDVLTIPAHVKGAKWADAGMPYNGGTASCSLLPSTRLLQMQGSCSGDIHDVEEIVCSANHVNLIVYRRNTQLRSVTYTDGVTEPGYIGPDAYTTDWQLAYADDFRLNLAPHMSLPDNFLWSYPNSEITLPEVSSMSQHVFSNPRWQDNPDDSYTSGYRNKILTTVNLSGTGLTTLDVNFDVLPSLEKVVLPDAMEHLESSFQECTKLTTLTLPAACTSIATENTSARFPWSLATINGGEQVEMIGANALGGTAWLSQQKGLVTLGRCAYTYMAQTEGEKETIEIPQGIRTIAPGFLTNGTLPANCVALPLNIPEGVTIIGKNAFEKSTAAITSEASLPLPASLEEIQEKALAGFVLRIHTLHLPAALKRLDNNALNWQWLNNRDSLHCYLPAANVPEVTQTSFGSLPSRQTALMKLHVPLGTREAYEASVWADIFKGGIEEDPSMGTGIQTAETEDNSLRFTADGVYVNGSATIYDASGALLIQAPKGGHIALPHGIYLVRLADRTVKVVR